MEKPSQSFLALYELDSHNVVNSSEWAIAVEKGRWSSHVREHTSERSHYMYKYLN